MQTNRDGQLATLKENATKLLREAHQQAHAQQRRLSKSRSCQPACDQLDADVRKRLSTFTPVKWAGKPRKLSPLTFASHGWNCLSSDMVQCVSCDQYLSVVLPSLVDVDVNVYQKAIRTLVSMITVRHHMACPYRYTSSGTGDAVPLKALSKDIVNQRYESMKKLDLEQIKLVIPEVPSAMIPETAVQKCRALIYFGWQKSKYLDDAVVCAYCGRTVGLWLLRGQVFDVEKQHHKWCTFASDTSRHTDGWQCRRFVLQCINSSKDLPATNWAAKAEVWKSAIMPKNTPAS